LAFRRKNVLVAGLCRPIVKPLGATDVLNVAETAFAELMLTTQDVAVPEQAPPHPEKRDPETGAALSVTAVPLG
jgi:hypothetical protein